MKLSGDWEKLAKKLEKLATDTPQKVGMTLKQVAEQTIKEVKEETPADTGGKMVEVSNRWFITMWSM